MAYQDYRRGEGTTPIQDMTTRQLRQYVREKAEEAQERIDSIEAQKNFDISDTSRAFQNQLDYVKSFGSGRGGSIKKDVSYMSKEEMAEYAYAIRDLNMLDTESKYARDLDYKENKDRYTKFIQQRTPENNINPQDREYWSQFLTAKGNVSKKGYTEYKNFINFLRNIDEVLAAYGYETIKDKYYEETDPQMQEVVAGLLSEVYMQNKGTGMSTSDLVEEFNKRLEDYKKSHKPAPMPTQKEKVSMPKSRKGKATSKNSKNSVTAKTTGKMKNGTVREKQSTKKV